MEMTPESFVLCVTARVESELTNEPDRGMTQLVSLGL